MTKRKIPIYCIRSGDAYRIIVDSTPRIGEEDVAHGELVVDIDPKVKQLIEHVNMEDKFTKCSSQREPQPCCECPECILKQMLHALPNYYKETEEPDMATQAVEKWDEARALLKQIKQGKVVPILAAASTRDLAEVADLLNSGDGDGAIAKLQELVEKLEKNNDQA